jgi:integrative and conjugative element protein (TIGR02256 family)
MPRLWCHTMTLLKWHKGLVAVSKSVMHDMSGFIQSTSDCREAGGILIGSYRGNHIEVSACTKPMFSDRRLRHLFDRNDKGHQSTAMAAWKASGHTDTYVGEWHTHPEDHPMPSSIDRLTWVRLTMRAKNPLIFVICGRKSLWWGIGKNGFTHQIQEVMNEPVLF